MVKRSKMKVKAKMSMMMMTSINRMTDFRHQNLSNNDFSN